jgi:hypothetical protein
VDEEGLVVGVNIGVRTAGKRLLGIAQSATVVLAAMDTAVAAANQPVASPTPPRR